MYQIVNSNAVNRFITLEEIKKEHINVLLEMFYCDL